MASGQTKESNLQKAYRKYDKFVKEYHLNGNNGSKAAIAAGYAKGSARQQARRLLAHDYVIKALAQLRADSDVIAEDEFKVSLEQRLRWLSEVAEEGLQKYADFKLGETEAGDKKPFNLHAVVSAVAELNKMCGTTDKEKDAPPLSISFAVNDSVGEVKVTHGR